MTLTMRVPTRGPMHTSPFPQHARQDITFFI